MNELKLVVNNNLGSISLNYKEIELALAEKLAEYKGIIFTEETIDIAKKERTSLKQLQKDLSDRRIAVKKEYVKPLDEFETKVKKLYEMIDKPIFEISTQLDDFEKKRIEIKKVEIENLYNDLMEELKDYLPLAKIYNQKWENKTYKLTEIEKELKDLFISTVDAINSIKATNSEVVSQALEKYKQDLSLANAIVFINNYETQKQAILQAEQKRQAEKLELERTAEIERIRADERKKVEQENAIREQERAAVTKEVEEKAEQKAIEKVTEMIMPSNLDGEEVIPYSYTIHLSDNAKDKLETYMDTAGIEFDLNF